jgi:Fe2+ transport system protein B
MYQKSIPQQEKVFNFASGLSLLLFYAFAMQCYFLLAITKKETNSWKWPWQLILMTGFAYVVALLAYYQLLVIGLLDDRNLFQPKVKFQFLLFF